MLNIARIAGYVLAGLSAAIGLALLIPAGCFLYIGFNEAIPYIAVAVGLQLFAGLLLWLLLRHRNRSAGPPPAPEVRTPP
jgi:Trk-type K+ transport system membrane component